MRRHDHSDAQLVEDALRRVRAADGNVSAPALLIVAVLLGWFLLACILSLSLRLVEVLRA